MKCAIYGSGAMGTVLGAFLTKGGVDVELIDVYENHVKKLNESGAKITGYENFTQPVKANLPSQMSGMYDLIILFTKQTANAEAFQNIKHYVDENSTILTLQNGVPEPKISEFFGEERTLGGTVEWGATFVEPGCSEVTQPLTGDYIYFNIGTISGEINDRVKEAAKVLEVMGPVNITENLMSARWSKLVWNCGMSGMSAALGGTFGEVMDSEKAMKQIGRICEEMGQVCKTGGFDFDETELPNMDTIMKQGGDETQKAMTDIFLDGYKTLRKAKASMLQDLEKGKPTEVDLINGFVSSEGKKYRVPTPVNDIVVDTIHNVENGKYKLSFKENLSRFPD